ncbi:MAG TPA: class I SAM-dependent methyltransferase, partial [Terriglobales bacterium]|nr:class I SAM-dependent methyltransferase [Terriglobales bacterium]
CRAEWPAFDDAAALARAPHPRDRSLRPLLAAVPGMATENKLVLLNRAVRHLAPGEIYVEIGCWHGLSLAGAVFGHPQAPVYACDDFSEFGGPRAALMDTLARWSAPGQVRFHDMDFRRFLAMAPWAPARVGVYFYDGAHDFDDQFVALQAMLPHLAPEALVVVDDTSWRHVRAANALFARHVPGFELVRDVRTRTSVSPAWWNGVQVYRWRGRPGTTLATPAGYAARRRWWDGAWLPAARAWWAARGLLARVPGARRVWRRYAGAA